MDVWRPGCVWRGDDMTFGKVLADVDVHEEFWRGEGGLLRFSI